MKIPSLISEAFVSAFGWTLLHAVWQGLVLAMIAAVALWLLRGRSSRVRYWTALSVFALQPIVSMITFGVSYQPVVQSWGTIQKFNQLQGQVLQAVRPVVAMPWYKQAMWFLQAHIDSVVLFWVIGASVLMLRLVGSWVYVQQLKAEGIQLTEARIQQLFKHLSDLLHIRQTVHLFESIKVNTPMVVGFIKPVVLLPVGLATGLTTKQIEAILAHELAHVKRYDYLVNLLQSLVEVVYFFHPALWWLSERVRTEREHCCDDLAVELSGDKLAFAQALAEVEAYRQTPLLALGFASKKTALLSRVKRVLGMAEKPARRFNPNALLLVLLLAAGVSVYAIQQDDPKPKKAKSTKNKTPKKAILEVPFAVENIESPELMPLGNLTELALIETVSPLSALMPEDTIDHVKVAYYQRKMDSLHRLMEVQHKKINTIHLEMEQHEFKIGELERKKEVVEWKKNKAQNERSQVLEKRSQLLHQESQAKKIADEQIEKSLAQFEEQVKQQEAHMQQFNQQMTELSQQEKTARQPIEKLEEQMHELEAINERLSEEMERYSQSMTALFPPPPPPPAPMKAPKAAKTPRAPRAVAPPPPPPAARKK